MGIAMPVMGKQLGWAVANLTLYLWSLLGLVLALLWLLWLVGRATPILLLLFAGGVVAVVLVDWLIATRLIHLAQAQSVFKRPSPMLHPLHAFAPQYKFCHNCGTRALRMQPFCTACGQQYPQ